MKRFIILSLTACLLLVANKAWACAGGDYGHYGEVFNIYSHTYTYDNSERLMQYWINYTGDRTPLSGKWKEERYYRERLCPIVCRGKEETRRRNAALPAPDHQIQ